MYHYILHVHVYMYVSLLLYILIVYLEDTSFLDMRVYEQFDKASNDITDSSVDKTEKDNEQSVVLTKEHELRMKLLTTLAECIGDVEKVGGTQSIPYLQVAILLLYTKFIFRKFGQLFSPLGIYSVHDCCTLWTLVHLYLTIHVHVHVDNVQCISHSLNSHYD